MTKLTYDELQQAFLAHRRAYGLGETKKVLASFDAENLEDIPEGRWAEALKALHVDALPGAEAKAAHDGSPTELNHDAIYAHWNSAGKRG